MKNQIGSCEKVAYQQRVVGANARVSCPDSFLTSSTQLVPRDQTIDQLLDIQSKYSFGCLYMEVEPAKKKENKPIS